MTRRVVLSPTAARYLDRFEAFLAKESERAARDAVRKIMPGVLSLDEMAERGTLLEGTDVREILIRHGGGGYLIRYRIRADVVTVTRMWHSREDRPRR